MNELDSHICFDALATLQNADIIDNVCNFCDAKHFTLDCPDLSRGGHVFDNSLQDLSRSSVPNGLHVIETVEGSCVVTSQKFAKGSRFGPLLARKSYMPIEDLTFPLIIFGNVMPSTDWPEFEELFKVRNIYLDTTDENQCNWMIHVNPAIYTNEQNLIAYQEESQIYFTAIQDIEIGDILKVWYAPKYGFKMGAEPLQPSPHQIVNNVLRQVDIANDSLEIEPDEPFSNRQSSASFYSNNNNSNSSPCSEVSLPPIQSIIKPSQTFPKNVHVQPDLTVYNRTEKQQQQQISQTPPLSKSAIAVNGLPQTNITTNTTNTNSSTNITDASIISITDKSTTVPPPTNDSLINQKNNSAHSFDSATDLNSSYDSNAGTDIMSVVNQPDGDATSLQSSTNKSSDAAKIYECGQCERKYATVSNLSKHVRNHNVFMCAICGGRYPNEQQMKLHECNTEKKSKMPQCSICLKHLSNSWSLTRHMKTHAAAAAAAAAASSTTNTTLSSTSNNTNESSTSAALKLNEQKSNGSTMSGRSLSETSLTGDFVGDVETEINAAIVRVENTISAVAEGFSSMFDDERLQSSNNIIAGATNSNTATPSQITVLDNQRITFDCTICGREFKTKLQLNKHLRLAHSVTTPPSSSSYINTDRQQQQKHIQSSQCETTPVRPCTAAALATKLNERHHNNIVRPPSNMTSTTTMSSIDDECLNGSSDMGSMSPKIYKPSPYPDKMPPLIPYHNNTGGNVVSGGHNNNNIIDSKLPSSSSSMPGAYQQSQSSGYSSNGMDTPQYSNQSNIDEKPDMNDVNSIEEDEIQESPSTSIFECDICMKTFKKKYQLRRHKQIHDNVKYICPFCENKSVKSRCTIMRHFRKEHASHMNLWRNPDFMSSMVIRLDDDEQTTNSSTGGIGGVGGGDNNSIAALQTPEQTFLDISAPQEPHVVVVPPMDDDKTNNLEKTLKTKRTKALKGKTKKRKLSTILSSSTDGISKDCDSIANDNFCENASMGMPIAVPQTPPSSVLHPNHNAALISTPVSSKGYGPQPLQQQPPPPLPQHLPHQQLPPQQLQQQQHDPSVHMGNVAPRRIIFDNRYQQHPPPPPPPQHHPQQQQQHLHQPQQHHAQQQHPQHQQLHPHQQLPPSSQHKPIVDWNCQPMMMGQQQQQQQPPQPPQHQQQQQQPHHPPHHHLNHNHHPPHPQHHEHQRRMPHHEQHHYYPHHHLGGC